MEVADLNQQIGIENRPDSLIKLYNNFETKSNISQCPNKTTPLSDISIKLR